MARNEIILDIEIPDYDIVCAQLMHIRTLCDNIRNSLQGIRQELVEARNALQSFHDELTAIPLHKNTKNKSKGRKK